MRAKFAKLKIGIADILAIFLALLLGFGLAKRESKSSLHHLSGRLNATSTFQDSARLEEGITLKVLRPKVEDQYIMERNLFAVDGKYDSKIDRLPENPYTLVGIMIVGKEKKALFRDYLGQQFLAKEKDILLDGSTVVKITDNKVVLRRGKQTRELFLLTPKREVGK